MNNWLMRRRHSINIFTCICFFLVLAVSMTGCENLRKKFTRKKKGQEEESSEIPILEPIEYPKKVHTPVDTYQYHYSLWRGWYKELLSTISEGRASKREQYLLNQILSNLTAMEALLPEDKQIVLKECLGRLRNVQTDMLAPVPLRSPSSWVIELESIEKKIRENYTVTQVKGFLTGSPVMP